MSPQGNGTENRSRGGKHRPDPFRAEHGSALVEMALITPLMMTLIMGVWSFSMAFFELERVQNVTVTAANQVVATARGTISDPCASVLSTANSLLPSSISNNLTYSLTINYYSNNSSTAAYTATGSAASFSCTNVATYLTQYAGSQGLSATLTLTDNYTWNPIYLLKFGTSRMAVSQSVIMY